MSVFESIKGTFHSAKQDIVDGLKALTSLDSQPRHDMLRRLRTDGVNLDAGADLLNKYQETWKELQEYTSQSAKNAEEVDGEIGRLYACWDHQADLVSRLEEEVAELPAVVTLIKKLTNDLGRLLPNEQAYIAEDCRVVEGAVERLENVCEELEHQKNRNTHLAQLTLYKQRKGEEVAKVKVQMARRHAAAMQDCEKRRETDLRERQEAFNEAFSQDMDYYKTTGNMDQLKVSDIPIPKVSSLSDITIDDDQKVINDFLASADTTPSRGRSTDDLGDTSEGGFFEDDYTTDYNIQGDEDILEEEIDEMSHEPPDGPQVEGQLADIDNEESGDERRGDEEEKRRGEEGDERRGDENKAVRQGEEGDERRGEEKDERRGEENKAVRQGEEGGEDLGKQVTQESQAESQSSKGVDAQGADNSS